MNVKILEKISSELCFQNVDLRTPGVPKTMAGVPREIAEQINIWLETPQKKITGIGRISRDFLSDNLQHQSNILALPKCIFLLFCFM
jgi:hypothetical protein